MGIITPMVNSAKEAYQAVAAVRYPTQGVREFGPAMAPVRWGVKGAGAYAKIADNEILVIAQIKHIAAVDAIDEIFSVPGFDLVFVGMCDLAASIALLGQVDHPSVVSAARRFLGAAQRADLTAGVIALEHVTIRGRREEGFQLIAVNTDTVLLSAGADGLLAVMSC
jgi:4-hydroxy-2-oxoheptanedioate aldolase